MRQVRADEQHATPLRFAAFEMFESFDRRWNLCEGAMARHPHQTAFGNHEAKIGERSFEQAFAFLGVFLRKTQFEIAPRNATPAAGQAAGEHTEETSERELKDRSPIL